MLADQIDYEIVIIQTNRFRHGRQNLLEAKNSYIRHYVIYKKRKPQLKQEL